MTDDKKPDDKPERAPEFDPKTMARAGTVTRKVPVTLTYKEAHSLAFAANVAYHTARQHAYTADVRLAEAKTAAKAAQEDLGAALRDRDARLREADNLLRFEEHEVIILLCYQRNGGVALEVRTDGAHDGEIWDERALTAEERQLRLADAATGDGDQDGGVVVLSALEQKALSPLRESKRGLTAKALAKDLDIPVLDAGNLLHALESKKRAARIPKSRRYRYLPEDNADTRAALDVLLFETMTWDTYSVKQLNAMLPGPQDDLHEALLLGVELGHFAPHSRSKWLRVVPSGAPT